VGLNIFYVLLTARLGIIFANNQLDAQFLFSCMFLYMFLAAMCPSSGALIVSIRHPVYVTLYRWQSVVQTCTPDSHLYRLTYTGCRIDTINAPDDGHMAAWNMQRIEINIHEKRNCVSGWLFAKISHHLLGVSFISSLKSSLCTAVAT